MHGISARIVCFPCPGVDWGQGSDFVNPTLTCWPGDLFGMLSGSQKTYFCDGMIFL